MPTKKYKREQIVTLPRQVEAGTASDTITPSRLPGRGESPSRWRKEYCRIESGPGRPGTWVDKVRSSFQVTSDEASQQNKPRKID